MGFALAGEDDRKKGKRSGNDKSEQQNFRDVQSDKS
jgi:hypothetical protein